MSFFKKIIFVVLLLNLISCATPLKQSELDQIKSVGIVNKFPDYPNYSLIGTTVFNNEFDKINDSKFHDKVTQTVKEYLLKRGYKVKILLKDDKENREAVDLVLDIIPRDIYQVPGTFGYGVNQRSLFGSALEAKVYVALNIGPFLHGKSKGEAFYNQLTVPLTIEKLPAKYNELSDNEKSEVEQKLSNGIHQAINDLLVKVGI